MKKATKTALKPPAAEDIDRRVRRSRKAVLSATLALLAQGGLGGVSVDDVSRRSGVAKTTIYRHWPSRSALLLDACSNLGSKPPVPDAGTLRKDLMTLATSLAAQLKSARWASILPSMIDAAEREPDLAEVHTRIHAGYMAPFYAVIERAQQRGEVSRERDAAMLVAQLVGPLFYRRWFSRESVDDKFVKSVVEAVLSQCDRK